MFWRALFACALLLPLTQSARAEGAIPVVTSFSILGDLVTNVGGDRVAVTSLVGPDGNTHAYNPRPTDIQKIANAKLVIINGLSFEPWINRLVESAGAVNRVVSASRNVVTLPAADADHSHVNPHAWQSIANVKQYVANIRDALSGVDTDATDVYTVNAAHYLASLDRLEAETRRAVSEIPEDRRQAAISHPSLDYFSKAYGIRFVSPQRLASDAEASARGVADLIASIKKDRVAAVFTENASDVRLMQRVAAEAGIPISGPLYLDALSEKTGPAPNYIAMMRHNVGIITAALRK